MPSEWENTGQTQFFNQGAQLEQDPYMAVSKVGQFNQAFQESQQSQKQSHYERLAALKQQGSTATARVKAQVQAKQQREWLSQLQQFNAPNTSDIGVYDSGGSVAALRGIKDSGSGANIVNIAKQFLGVPYVWGGSSPRGFDCSGLVQYVFAKAGIKMPRVSSAQATAGRGVSREAAQPGDVIAFNYGSGRNGRGAADHVGIYIGNGQVLEAPRRGVPVRIAPVRWGSVQSIRRMM